MEILFNLNFENISDMNLLSLSGLVLIVIGTICSFFGTYFSDKKGQTELSEKIGAKDNDIDSIKQSNKDLIFQNGILLKSNDLVSSTNKGLIGQNTDMLDRIAKYQNDIERKNEVIESLQQTVQSLKDYNYYSTLNIYGLDKIYSDDFDYDTDLSKLMKKIVVRKSDTRFSISDSPTVLTDINELLLKYPHFPFANFVKYRHLKSIGDENWRKYALAARKQFEITTSIEGHSMAHDEALRKIVEDLSTNR